MSAGATHPERACALPSYGRSLLELGRKHSHPAAVSIALDDALAERVGVGSSPATLRIWRNGRALVLPEWRLRRSVATAVVDDHGQEWPVCARGSGGTAVAHGPGTLNMSIALPLTGQSRPTVEEAYRIWIQTLANALREACGVAIGADMVESAYCSGSYDAVVEGRKLAGTAQARRNHSVLVHGTILMSINREEYIRLIQEVEHVVGMSPTHGPYDPDRIVSLHEITGRRVTAVELAQSIAQTSRATDTARSRSCDATTEELRRAWEIAMHRTAHSFEHPRSQQGATGYDTGL